MTALIYLRTGGSIELPYVVRVDAGEMVGTDWPALVCHGPGGEELGRFLLSEVVGYVTDERTPSGRSNGVALVSETAGR